MIAVRDRWGAVAVVAAICVALAVIVFRLGDQASAAIEFSDPNVWVEHGLDGDVIQINGSSGEVIARVTVAEPGDDILALPHGTGAVVLNRTRANLRFVDASALRASETIEIDDLEPSPQLGLIGAPTDTGDAVLITDEALVRIDPRTEVLTTLATADGRGTILEVSPGRVVRLTPGGGRIEVLGTEGLEPLADLPEAVEGDRNARTLVSASGVVYVVDPDRLSVQAVGDSGELLETGCLTSAGADAKFSGTHRRSAHALPRIVAHNGPAGVLVVSQLDSSTCFDVELPVSGDEFGTPVVVDDTAYIPDYARGRIVIVDLESGRIRQNVPFSSVPGRPFELEVLADMVWANEPQGPFAAILEPDGITTVQKVESVLVASSRIGDIDSDGASEGSSDSTSDLRAIGDSGDEVLTTGTAGDAGEAALPGDSSEVGENSATDFDPSIDSEVLGIAVEAGTNGNDPNDPSQVLRASFRVSSLNVPAGEPVEFTDQSTGTPIAWAWDFGDGTGGIGPSVIKIWDAEGIYRVELLVANGAGRESSASVEINVLPPTARVVPVADFVFDRNTIEPGETITFESRSTGDIESLTWDFGDGASAAGDIASHRFDQVGEFAVVLTATGPAGSSTASTIVRVIPRVEPPIAAIEPLPNRIVTGQIVALRSISRNDPTSSSWDFGDGRSSSRSRTSHAWSTPGTYRLRLSVTNAAGSDSTFVDVRVDPAADPPVARFGQSGLETVIGEPLQFTDLSRNEPTSLQWTFGDGASADGPDVSHSWSEPGRYRVILTVGNEAGTDRKAKTVTVRLPVFAPEASFNIDDSRIATGTAAQFSDTSINEPTAWRWDFGDGSSSSSQSPSHTFSRAGTYVVRLTASNVGGSGSAERVIEVIDRPTASFSATADELEVSFSDTSGGNPSGWAWDFGDGTTSSSQNPTHRFSRAGTYLVSLVVSNDVASSSTTVEVVVARKPDADFSHSSAGLTVDFTDESEDATSWNWQFDDGTASDQQHPTHKFEEPGTYNVTLTVSNAGGSDDVTRRVRVRLREPTVDIDCSRDRFIITCDGSGSKNAASYAWSAPDAILISGVNEPIAFFVFGEPGRFRITLEVTSPDGVTKSKTVRSPRVDGADVPDITDVDIVSNTNGVVELRGFADNFPTSWQWSIEGGTLVSGGGTDRPTFSFVRNGTYAGVVTASNELGTSDPVPFAVNISGLEPDANFTWTPGTAERVIRFTNTSKALPGYSLEWDFDGGEMLNGNLESPRVRFPTDGTYRVVLTVVDDNGLDRRARNVTVDDD
ncbi:MAG: PKD domain-containing protein [Acidimicrobiales bacterium]